MEKAIHGSRLAGNSKADASQDNPSSRGEFCCHSNSRRTVQFVMNDIRPDKVEEDHVEKTMCIRPDDSKVQDYVEDYLLLRFSFEFS